MKKNNLSRRQFFGKSALYGVAAVAAVGAVGATSTVGGVLTSCSSSNAETGFTPLVSDLPMYLPGLQDVAIPGKALKVGWIGCGNRGSGAVMNCLAASPGSISIVAAADVLPDRMEKSIARIEKSGIKLDLTGDRKYIGFDAYKELIDNNPDLDIVIITSPTVFHSEHTKYAIDKGINVFVEKPASVDARGCREMLVAAKIADTKGLSIVTGTQRRHQRNYNESYEKVREGMIGEIVGGKVCWNQGPFGGVDRKPGWKDMEYMIRDFFSWNWLCGDHILDQGVHNIDVFSWFSHLKPVSALGMGSRLQRRYGDIYDNFSVDVVFEGNVHVHFMARQMAGCTNEVGEFIQGTKGSWSSREMAIRDLDGNIIWKYDKDAEKVNHKQNNPYVLEHVDLINSIRSNKPMSHLAQANAFSSAAAIMGRESAYTGKECTYDEFIGSDLDLMPKKLHLGNVKGFKDITVPLPGEPRSKDFVTK